RIAERRVHDNDPAGRRCRDVDIVDTDAGAAYDLQGPGLFENFCGDLGSRADRQTVVIADGGGELFLVLAEGGLEIGVDAAILENLYGRRRESVGNEYLGHDRLTLPWSMRFWLPRKPNPATPSAPQCRHAPLSRHTRRAGRAVHPDKRRCRRRRLLFRADRPRSWRTQPGRRQRAA